MLPIVTSELISKQRGYKWGITSKDRTSPSLGYLYEKPREGEIASFVVLDGPSLCYHRSATSAISQCFSSYFWKSHLLKQTHKARFAITKWDTPYCLLSSSGSFSNIAQEISVAAAIAVSG